MSTQENAYIQKWKYRLNNANFDMRVKAAEKLGLVKSEDAVKVLSQCLNNGPTAVRAQAAKSLGKIGSAEAVPALIKLLNSDNAVLACAAADSLGQIGSSTAVPALAKVLKTYKTSNRHKQIHGYDRGVYTAAANALKKIGNLRAHRAIYEYYR